MPKILFAVAAIGAVCQARRGGANNDIDPLFVPDSELFGRGYFRTEEWRAKDAATKTDELWQACQEFPELGGLATQYYKMDRMFSQDQSLSFTVDHDEMPVDRPKIVHAEGLVARVEWQDLGGHDFSGMFEGGTPYGLIRLSETNFDIPGTSIGLTPSLSLKFPISGRPSANLMGNTSFAPTRSFNFFANDIQTIIKIQLDTQPQHQQETKLNGEIPARFDGQPFLYCPNTIGRRFVEVNNRNHALGTATFGRFDHDGSELDKVEVSLPFDLFFRSPASLANILPEEREFRDGEPFSWLKQVNESVEPGQVLYEVWAWEEPNSEEPIHIANIFLKDRLIESKFGDSRLFFQHIAKEEDFEFEPGFEPFLPPNLDTPWDELDPKPEDATFLISRDNEEAKDFIASMMSNFFCPFAWFLNPQ